MLRRALDIIAWLGAALVLAAVAVFFSRPQWIQWSRWLAWGGLVCILLYALGQWREIVRMFAGRHARLGAISAASVLVVLGILAAINYISSREHTRWDLTAAGEYSLSPQAKKVLEGLKEPLKLTVFARESEFPRFKERLPEYAYVSDKVKVEYVDLDKRPAVARQMQIQAYNTIAIEYQGRIERVTSDTEQEIVNGIIKAVTGQERKVYFTQGHGEKDTASSDERSGYSGILTQLGRDNYKAERLVLAQVGDVPGDASMVVVAGPRTDLLAPEVDGLRRYLAKGGKLFLMLDPPERVDAAPPANLIALAREWAVEIGNGVVVDVSGVGRLLGTDETVPVVATYPNHPIVDDFNLLTAYPLARPVTAIAGGVSSRFAQAFAETSGNSWAESDVKTMLTGGEIKFEEAGGDKKGPITIGAAVAAAVENAAPAAAAEKKDDAPKAETRVVVLGDSDFASNGVLGIQGNRDLFMNVLGWLAQDETLIAIRPREAGDQRITMTSSQQTRVLLVVLLVIPALVLGNGVYSWWRRR